MPVLKLTRWILLYLLSRIGFTAGQNITVLINFNAESPASVFAADPNAATYWATTTNICRSGPCSPLTIYTNLYVQGPSTVALSNYGAGNSQTYACVVTSSLLSGTCTYEGTWNGTIQDPRTTSAVPDDFLWWPLTVTAGQDKLSGLTVPTTNSVASASSTATPASSPSACTPPTSSSSASTSPTNSSSASTPSTSSSSASTPLASGTVSNGSTSSTISSGSTATKGAAAGCQTGYLSYAIAGLAGVVIAAL